MSARLLVLSLLLMGTLVQGALAQYSVVAQNRNARRNNNHSLVIGQTQDIHNQVGDLLQQLRRGQDQQVAIGTPFHTLNDSFYERNGVNFGFDIRGARRPPGGDRGSAIVGLNPDGSFSRNIQFRQGSFQSAIPPFGGYDPSADARIGFGMLGRGGGGFSLNFAGGQGSSRSHVSQTPTIVLPNGRQGSVIDARQTPFVTGIIPIVGRGDLPYFSSMPTFTVSPLRQRIAQLKQQGYAPSANRHEKVAVKASPTTQSSSANHGDISVAEIRQKLQAEKENKSQAKRQEMLVLIERAQGAEQTGKLGAAKIYYRQAARLTTGETREALLDKIKEIKNSSTE